MERLAKMYQFMWCKTSCTLVCGGMAKGKRGLPDVWSVPPARDNDHPAPFPVELPARAIEACAPKTVFDPFCGSGTTVLSALNHGRNALGCDASEVAIDSVTERLKKQGYAYDLQVPKASEA